MKQKPDLQILSDLTFEEMDALVMALGEPRFRAGQLRQWFYRRLAASFDEMTDLPLAFRQALAARAGLCCLKPLREVSGADGTVKTLFALDDGKNLETALIPSRSPAKERHTLCVSTQVGCPVGCTFCATGRQGFERNLRRGEIIDQALYFARRLKEPGKGSDAARITNLVFMGMGEPLLNYAAVWSAVETLNAPEGFGLGARNITISTSGIVPGIKRLAGEKLEVNLAVSLHAADDALRDSLVPVNRKYPLKMLLPACREYVEATGRRISFEYILFAGINDSVTQARRLAHLLARLNCHVNLIAANPTGNKTFRPPARQAILEFENELRRLGINATLRQSRGTDIDGGCGQLRSRQRANTRQ
ncbi:MAG: 23S rRNA (adenine(2503)-C(2))-methyltransferase RlmN [Chloroflexi bacterium]|nr:23S rRNA (adenine(2503)-C(2))-methyltransferase RlmN [Chloroflexota bacterium]